MRKHCQTVIDGLKFGFGFSQSEILFSEVLTHAAERVSLGAKHLQYILALFPGETNHRLGMTSLGMAQGRVLRSPCGFS